MPSRNEKRFENLYALVTGAAGGIGQAIVDRLRQQGAKVAAADLITTAIDADAHLPGDLTDHTHCDALAQAGLSLWVD